MKRLLFACLVLALLLGCSEPTPPQSTPPESTPAVSAGPGGCQSQEECEAFCAENPAVCEEFCRQHPETCTSSNEPPAKETPSLTPEPKGLGLDLPLAFTYSVPMHRGEEKFERRVVFFLEMEQECFGRDAVAGVISSYDETESPEQAHWSKFTLYLDNGEIGSSGGLGQSGLAFDDAKPMKVEYDLLTQLNCVLASAGENFNNSDAWESGMPVILNGIGYSGTNTGWLGGSLSLAKTGASSAHAVPCTEFSANFKSAAGNTSGMVYCVAGLDSEILQPYTVSISYPGMENGSEARLEKIEEKGSGLAFYPQCLEPVYCPEPAFMSDEEREACNSQGKTIQEMRDKQGCIITYECFSDLEWAKNALVESQPDACPEPSDELAEEAAKCISKGIQPLDFKMDSDGCYVFIDCG